MSNVVADLLPLSAVAILSFIAWLDISVLEVDTRTALADAAPYMIGWFSFLFVSPGRRFATVRSFVHTFTLLLAALLLNWQFNLHAEVGLRQLYRDVASPTRSSCPGAARWWKLCRRSAKERNRCWACTHRP